MPPLPQPRLEAASDGTGPVPHYAPAGSPPPEPAKPPGDLAALQVRLSAARLAAFAIAGGRIQGAFPIVPHNELARLNADLAEIRRLNAGLTHNLRSRRVAA